MKPASRLILSTSPPAETGEKSPGMTALRCRRRLPCRGIRYRPTGKELDTETGLYYFGARYLDPKTGRWISGDPAVGEYIPSAPINDEARKRNESLPGMGGVFNVVNLHVYHYAGNNPIIIIDPNGEFNKKQFVFAVLQTVGGTVEVIGGVAGAAPSGGVSLFMVVHGIGNIGDGIIGIVAAAKDKEWGGAVYEVSKAVLSNVTDWDENTVEAASSFVAVAEGGASSVLTRSANMARVMQRGGKQVQKASDAMGIAGIGNNVIDTTVSGYHAVTNTSNQSEPSNNTPQVSNINQMEQ